MLKLKIKKTKIEDKLNCGHKVTCYYSPPGVWACLIIRAGGQAGPTEKLPSTHSSRPSLASSVIHSKKPRW